MKCWRLDGQEPHVKLLISESYDELVFALRNEKSDGKSFIYQRYALMNGYEDLLSHIDR